MTRSVVVVVLVWAAFFVGRLSMKLDIGTQPDYRAKYEVCRADILSLLPPPNKTK